MTEEKKAKLAKLKKLLALAGNNPNKAEALAAIEKARHYASEYGLTMAEAEATTTYEDFGPRAAYSGTKKFGYVDQFLWKTIANFCRCKVGTGTDEDGDLTIVFFGHEVDVELAHHIRSTIKAAMAFEWGIWKEFVLNNKYTGNDLDQFHYGIAVEMRDLMHRENEIEAKNSNSTALVVKKWELVNAAAQQHGFNEARGGRGRTIDTSSASFQAGREAGKRIDIGRGVAGRGVKMIGSN